MGRHPLSQPWYNYKPKPCRTCGTEFQPNNSCHVHCSEDCRQKSLRINYLRRNYDISLEEYDRRYAEQQALCAICKKEGVKLNKYAEHSLAVDHCHKDGHVRGLLCANCNRGLGLFGDDVERLKAAIDYLEKSS